MKNLFLLYAAGAIALTPLGASAQDQAQIDLGKSLFNQWCLSCHGMGPGHPGTQALDQRYQGAMPGALEERTNLSPELVSVFVRNGISIMPFFRKTEISDSELAAIGAYLSTPQTNATK
ncbi:cytochrome c [Candidimonas sp. SYP-B2681]|uniref:c-type cytochrome n=1 Tax=Candidimonas sp. SYP-B2681 TaxID=2497686 RepID=UPI000F88782F|nr:cytochrome c [Candidimonas sp. SYP-B2681]RTZ45458.1 cytochrome c [Candidimonas sp. SYP-B2681]